MYKQRDYNGEIVRLTAIVGICLLHGSSFGNYPCRSWINLFYCFLDAFVVISGWYGIKFSWSKLLRLLVIAISCAILDAILYDGILLGNEFWWRTIVTKLFSHWYLNCYLVLMLMSPILNLAIETAVEKKKELFVFLPFFILTFGWSWLSEKGARWFPLPPADGLGSFTFLTLSGIYVVGRLLRIHASQLQFRVRTWFCLWIFGTLACVLGLGWYASPFTVLGAVGLFMFLMRLPVNAIFGRFAAFVSPSVLSIYLLHAGPEGYWFVRWLDCGQPLGYLFCGLMLFFVGLLIDLIFRRGLLYVAKAAVRTLRK